MQLIVRPVAFTLAITLLVSAGCGATTPSPSPAPSLRPSPTARATASQAPVQAPATLAPAPSGPAAPAVEDLALESHRIPADYAGHVTAVISLGSEIVWSGGPHDGDNDLFRYVPGTAEPELLWRNPRRDSVLTAICGSATGYVFTDERWVDGQPRGWRLWYLTAAGAQPVLLDQSTDDRLPSPTLAMSDRYISWEAVHGTWDDRTNELRVAAADDPLNATTLLSYPGTDTYVDFPSLWANELWYGIVANDWAAGTEYPRVEMIDLDDRVAGPQAFGADQRAFMPAPARDVVAWKGGGALGLSALNSGELTIYERATGLIDALPIPGPDNAADRISYPSVGNRFVSWWDDIHPRFYVYDLVERRFRRIAEYDWATEEAVFRPTLSGDLLAYMHRLENGDSFLEWGLLPT